MELRHFNDLITASSYMNMLKRNMMLSRKCASITEVISFESAQGALHLVTCAPMSTNDLFA